MIRLRAIFLMLFCIFLNSCVDEQENFKCRKKIVSSEKIPPEILNKNLSLQIDGMNHDYKIFNETNVKGKYIYTLALSISGKQHGSYKKKNAEDKIFIFLSAIREKYSLKKELKLGSIQQKNKKIRPVP